MVRPKGNKWFLGLRVTQLREAIVFDKADGQAQIMCISFTSRGFFSGFDNYWREMLRHTCKINSCMPSALATLPLTMLAGLSQQQAACLNRYLCRGEGGLFSWWVSSACVVSCLSRRIHLLDLSSCFSPLSWDFRRGNANKR